MTIVAGNENSDKKGQGILPDYEVEIGAKPKKAEDLLDMLRGIGGFSEKVKACGIEVNWEENMGEGFSSRVYKCVFGSKESVVKFSSLRRLTVLKEEQNFKDIKDDPKEEAVLRRQFELETYAYTSLSKKRKENLALPFVVAILVNGNIYDYIFCMNLPCYETIGSKLGNGYGEKAILTAAKDILYQLSEAHSVGIRHRDIKRANIMYDKDMKKFVLIDWGSSCLVAKDFVYEIKESGAYSDVYVDPVRFKDKEPYKPIYDLYSVGVFMAYMAHSGGYKAERNESEFHGAVCPGSIFQLNGNCVKTLPSDFYEKLRGDGISEDFCEIVKKAMTHEEDYNLHRMLSDVEAILKGDNKNGLKGESVKEGTEGKTKMPEKIKVNGLFGLLAFLLLAYTYLISGSEGISSVFRDAAHKGLSSLILAYLAAAPFIIIGISSKGFEWTKEIRIKSIIMPVIAFIIMTLPSALILKGLKVAYPLSLMGVQLIASIVGYMVIDRVGKKGIYKTLSCIAAGALGGGLTGYFIDLCLMKEKEIWTNATLGIVIPTAICGIAVGILYSCFSFWYNTRLKWKR